MAAAAEVDPVAELGFLAEDLRAQLALDRAAYSDEEAISAFESALYEVLLGHDDAAAERFWVLEGALDPGTPLQSDASWYLADALARLDLVNEAERRLAKSAADPEDLFRVDAVRALLGLYARHGRTAELETLARNAEAWGLLGEVADVRYALGRGLFELKRMADVERVLAPLPQASPDYGRALYVRAAAAVELGDLARAEGLLGSFAGSAASTPDAARVRDQAMLAMARISWGRGNVSAASDWYARVPEGSAYLSTSLGEAAWLAIARSEPGVALRAVDVALLRVPDNLDAVDLVGIRGALLLALGDPTGASGAYGDAMAVAEAARAALEAAGPDGPQVGTWIRAAFDADAELRSARAVLQRVSALRADIDEAQLLARDLLGDGAAVLTLRRLDRIRAYALQGISAGNAVGDADPRAVAAVRALTDIVARVDAMATQEAAGLRDQVEAEVAVIDGLEPSLVALEAAAATAMARASAAATQRLSARIDRAEEVAAAGVADASFAGLLATTDRIESLLVEKRALQDAVDARFAEVGARAQ